MKRKVSKKCVFNLFPSLSWKTQQYFMRYPRQTQMIANASLVFMDGEDDKTVTITPFL